VTTEETLIEVIKEIQAFKDDRGDLLEIKPSHFLFRLDDITLEQINNIIRGS